jgi:hypothetical protein
MYGEKIEKKKSWMNDTEKVSEGMFGSLAWGGSNSKV